MKPSVLNKMQSCFPMPVYNAPSPDSQTPVSCFVEQSKHHKKRLAQWYKDHSICQVSPAVAWSLLECEGCFLIKNSLVGTSLVVQWLRICLTIQGIWVQSLVWKDRTCHGATKPMHHNYRAHALESMLCSKRSHHSKKPVRHN